MAKSAQIRARVEPDLKERAEGIFATLGLTPTEAIRLFYRQVVLTDGIPFNIRIPNESTLRTMDRTDRGEDLHSFETAEELFEELGF